jgi:type IV pilus assembly protein PilC
MPDFRFEGTTAGGKPVHGILQGEKLKDVKAKAERLAKAKNFKLDRVLPRKTFTYRVSKGAEKPVKGEQKAFTREEVRAALERLGYKVHNINPKLFEYKAGVPMTEVVTFVRVSADLLREKLPFNEVLQLLQNDIANNTLREAVKEINSDLQSGKDSEEAFVRQEKALGKFTARMLGLASKSGNMVDIYESTANFLERQQEFKKNLKSALVMPMFTLLILLGAVVFYVAYIFPQTAELFVRMGIDLPPMTKGTLAFSNWLLDNMAMLGIVTVAIIAGVVFAMQQEKVQMFRDRYIWKLPAMGGLIHKTTIEIYCRVFYALYSGAGESIDAIKLSAEACGNKYMENQIKTVAIPLMLSKGVGLVEAFEASGVFTKTALSRFHSGAETGSVKKTALQIANYYEKETVYKMKNVVEFVQIIVAMVIMIVMTALTIVSSETATIKPSLFLPFLPLTGRFSLLKRGKRGRSICTLQGVPQTIDRQA